MAAGYNRYRKDRKIPSEPLGGYDYDFVQEIHKRFICSICTNVLKDPYLMVCCGQKCCHSCLQNSLRVQSVPTCPYCRAKQSGQQRFQYVIEKGMKSEIESFQILCVNHTEGCEWIGELRYLDGHLKSNEGCDFYQVTCPNKCQENDTITQIKRKDLQTHLMFYCQLRKLVCQYCDEVTTVKSYPEHKQVCKLFPMKCPNSCGEQGLVRQTVSAHREICKLEVIECKYAYIGCRMKLKRQDMPQHLMNYQGNHLEKMTEDLQRVKLEMNEKSQIIQKELSFAEEMHGSSTWLLSMKTQIEEVRNLFGNTFYFRMLHMKQIRTRQKDWFSPEFQLNEYIMKLHVIMERLSNALKLELCLFKDLESANTQSHSFGPISIKLLRSKSVKSGQQFWNPQPHNFVKSRLYAPINTGCAAEFRYVLKKPVPVEASATRVLETWRINLGPEWDLHYVDNDTVLWTVSMITGH